jgi:hypothetical protein
LRTSLTFWFAFASTFRLGVRRFRVLHANVLGVAGLVVAFSLATANSASARAISAAVAALSVPL